MQTVITNISFEQTKDALKSKYSQLSDTGSFFALLQTEYDNAGNVQHDFLDVIDEAITCGYEYVNTIVYPVKNRLECAISDNVKYVVWFCKKHSAITFDKDAIREKHIWKDVEWGKREKNYNPKGKDPGNVWIPTEDDGKANITDHILLEDEGVIRRLLAMSMCGDDYELIQEVPVRQCGIVRDEKRVLSQSQHEIFDKVFFKSSEAMTDVRDNSVKVVVTSPPYWNLKDYFKEGQIGQESYETYLTRMRMVWSECYKKLSDDGSLWININIRVQSGKIIPIPHDFVKMCKDIGFYYKGIVIWHKSSGIPTGDKNIVDRHEYILIFSKTEYFTVNKSIFRSFADYKNDAMNGGGFWNINRKAGSVGKKFIHPAIYPNDLVTRILLAASEEGDVSLDPFLGSGTSLIAAHQNKRAFIGYEFNEGFKELMLSRVNDEIPDGHIDFIS